MKKSELPSVNATEVDEKIITLSGLDFPPRKLWIKTFGCQMNYHDSERICSHLKSLNYTRVENSEDADLVIFNTCAIRDLANTKFYSSLGKMKKLKKIKGDKLIIGVAGCVAQSEGKELIKRFSYLDFAFGTDVIDQVNDMVFRVHSGDNRFAINTWDKSSNYSIETKIVSKSPQAFVNIIKGCDKFCSYCIVPFTRGREKSRLLSEVVEDVKKLVKFQGIQEVTLLGQNVNSFGKENNESIAQLIGELDKVEGLQIIRYTTSHPYDVSDELIQMHGTSKKLSRHLHLPVQSGSTTVLQRMRREYTAKHFMGLVKKLKEVRPDIVISSDIIVGFPNETDEEFEDTIKLLDEAQFDFIYSYLFSPRNHTKAARIIDETPHDLKKLRLHRLQEHQLEIQKNLRQEMIGRTYRILVDGTSMMRGEKKWKGRTNCNRLVHFLPEDESVNLLWHWCDVKINESSGLAAKGDLVIDNGLNPPEKADGVW